MTVIRSIRLFFQEGSSDKVYHASIVEDGEDGGAYSVEVEWGRRNGPLNRGKKAIKVSLAAAEKTFEQIVREKTGKGYQEISEGVAPAAVAPPEGHGSASRVAGAGRKRMNQAAQLLNAIEADDVDRLLSDHSMIVQQKLDGIRILTHVGQEIIATNRKGEITSFDASIARALSVLPSGTVVDGEVIAGDAGPVYWLFDLLQHGGEDLRPRGYLDRYLALERALATCAGPVSLVHTARQEADKRALFLALERQGAEGVVFKRVDAPYKSGRPASGGTQLKYKFIKSADVFVTSNAGNAYQMAVYDDGRIREVGKVFAGTTNESRARIDALLAAGGRPVAEVRYLYATDGDVLYQPVFDRLREDKSPEDCVLDQLRRTNRTVVTQRAAPRDAEPRRPWIPVPPKAAARDIHRPWIPRPKG